MATNTAIKLAPKVITKGGRRFRLKQRFAPSNAFKGTTSRVIEFQNGAKFIRQCRNNFAFKSGKTTYTTGYLSYVTTDKRNRQPNKNSYNRTTATMEPTPTITPGNTKKSRGRPKGSTNKPKNTAPVVKKSRGRPKGSKNKPKVTMKVTPGGSGYFKGSVRSTPKSTTTKKTSTYKKGQYKNRIYTQGQDFYYKGKYYVRYMNTRLPAEARKLAQGIRDGFGLSKTDVRVIHDKEKARSYVLVPINTARKYINYKG
jgi:hypothetical protein